MFVRDVCIHAYPYPHPRTLAARYDKGNAAHRLIKKQIEEGDGLPDTAYTWEMDEALQKVHAYY